ncbi:uncharacterized protein RHIMIDRAFT_89377 [Rhizopus microsporus ATCC 52813]|uniref:Uncharacterized protein n=1 Tax=Rhizopus microsporus ATCC 52813 TaxID=1340429 RepID=A0A2G4T3A1_RHIZD|nr:uncharacterized protein RHIMIDRAFT_89377 [Rhizopus microsporus ATCC 52813]PHZ15485.1 hypothetical protein RHIMIDRAFT_89377 [Rhizopus microsporus ATCC 52813]
MCFVNRKAFPLPILFIKHLFDVNFSLFSKTGTFVLSITIVYIDIIPKKKDSRNQSHRILSACSDVDNIRIYPLSIFFLPLIRQIGS